MDFKHLSFRTYQKSGVDYYSVRLAVRFDRKTIALGTDNLTALNLAKAIDDSISQQLNKGNTIDLDTLKGIATDGLATQKEKEQGIVRVVSKNSIQDIWANYVAFHTSTKQWTKTYVLTHIQTVTSLVTACPVERLEDKNKLVEWFFGSKERTPATSKNRLKLVVAAIDWSSKQGTIPRNWGLEYRDLLSSITIKTEQRSMLTEDDDINIFSVKEIYLILDALKNDTYSRFQGKHQQYYLYAYFCWLTGCRPSEAVALKWKNVDLRKGVIKFSEGQVYVSGQLVKKQGTKTKPIRCFPINDELKKLLSMASRQSTYVFTNNLDKPISHTGFQGIFKTVQNALKIPYRTPYQLRHSMISYHANNGYALHKLAEIVGNSSEVIQTHYLYLDIEKMSLPSIL